MEDNNKKEINNNDEILNNNQSNTDNYENSSSNESVGEKNWEEELQVERDKFLRMFAEFENFKKRTAKEKLEMYATASESVMVSLLPVLDDFERAIVQISTDDNNANLAGIQLIYNKFKDILTAKGLTLIDLKSGDNFDADVAEAVTQIPAGDEQKGKIVDVIEKGYKLGDKIIRFPKVVIGQ